MGGTWATGRTLPCIRLSSLLVRPMTMTARGLNHCQRRCLCVYPKLQQPHDQPPLDTTTCLGASASSHTQASSTSSPIALSCQLDCSRCAGRLHAFYCLSHACRGRSAHRDWHWMQQSASSASWRFMPRFMRMHGMRPCVRRHTAARLQARDPRRWRRCRRRSAHVLDVLPSAPSPPATTTPTAAAAPAAPVLARSSWPWRSPARGC